MLTGFTRPGKIFSIKGNFRLLVNYNKHILDLSTLTTKQTYNFLFCLGLLIK